MKDDLLASIAALDWQRAQPKKISVRIDGMQQVSPLKKPISTFYCVKQKLRAYPLPASLQVSMRQDRQELTFQRRYAFLPSNWRSIPKHDNPASYRAEIT